MKLVYRLVVTLSAFSAIAAEPAWWTQQKIDCGLSPSLAYNTWVAQGSPCPRKDKSTSGNSAGAPQNQIILDAAGQVGTAIGSAIHKQLFGDPAEEARQQAAAQEQQRAAAEAAAEAERKRQEKFTRLRSMLKLDTFDGDSGGGLLLKDVDVEAGGGLVHDSGGKLSLKFGDDDDTLRSSVATPKSGPALKFGDDDLEPLGTRASAKSGVADSPNTDPKVVDLRDAPSGLARGSDGKLALKLGDDDPPAPNTDPMVVDLRGTTKTAVDSKSLKNAEAIAAATQPAVIAMPLPDAVPAIPGATSGQLQEANNTYHQSGADATTVEFGSMADKSDEPQSLVQRARQKAKDAGNQALGAATSSFLEKIPGYSTTDELYGKYQEMNITVKGIAGNFESMFEDQAISTAWDLGSPGSLNGLAEENSQQLNKMGNDAQKTALKAAGKKAGADLGEKLKQDKDQAVVGENPLNVVPIKGIDIPSPFPLRPQPQTKH